MNLYNYICGGRRRRVTCPSKLARYSQAVTPCLTSFNPNHGGEQKQATTKFFFNTLRAAQNLPLGT